MKYNVPHGWVTVKVERVGITARMIVENSSDMVHRDVEELLKPFNRGHHTRQSGDAPDGAGLGLAIVQMIATQHDGTVSLSARQRGQLTVTVELPAV
ncbi:sensor histidine kinase, partial [Rhizobium johnstonii]